MRSFRSLALVMLPIVFGCHQPDDPDQQQGGWVLKPVARDAVPVGALRKLQGIYPVGSRITDSTAPGGFGPCENYPFDLRGNDWGERHEVTLIAFPDERVAYFKHCGLAVRLVNRTRGVASFPACDSSLFLVQEARAENGRWHAIEALPQEICGNSFHRVALKPNQYWQFPARVYDGPIKTKLRFRLDTGGQEPLYSNEFDGAINAAQLEGEVPEHE